MKYKIQIYSGRQGWSDVKESIDGISEVYKTSLYDTEIEADREADDFRDLEYQVRIVTENIEEDFNLY